MSPATTPSKNSVMEIGKAKSGMASPVSNKTALEQYNFNVVSVDSRGPYTIKPHRMVSINYRMMNTG